MEELVEATLGGGCFWCLEAVYTKLEGVKSVVPGYGGGSVETSFETLLEWFWSCHDPTTLNRQGRDIGTQYRSVIFYENENQKSIAHKSKKDADSSGIFENPIVTEIHAIDIFYPAEDYHHD